MNRTKYLKGACQHCGGHIEYPAEHIGMTAACPHCQQETELLLLAPPAAATVPRRALVWTAIAVVTLSLGLGGALLALKRAQRWAEHQKSAAATQVPAPVAEAQTNAPAVGEETNSPASDGLTPSTVSLEKTPGSSLVYAVGTLKNTSNRRRFGVKVELELSDAAGQKLGTASDYRQVLDPGAQWQFKALVMDSKTAAASIAAIKEDPGP